MEDALVLRADDAIEVHGSPSVPTSIDSELREDAMSENTIPLEQALRAQKALRDAAGLAPEQFPIPAFVGMISDEIDALRQQGHSDEQIAELIRKNAQVAITAKDLSDNYAEADRRHPPHEQK